MKKIILFTVILAITMVFTACEGDTDDTPTNPADSTDQQPIAQFTTESSPEPSPITTQLTVWGMTCGKCVNKIKGALSDIDGIIEVEVNLDDEIVTVEHEFDLDVGLIESAITGEGFNIP